MALGPVATSATSACPPVCMCVYVVRDRREIKHRRKEVEQFRTTYARAAPSGVSFEREKGKESEGETALDALLGRNWCVGVVGAASGVTRYPRRFEDPSVSGSAIRPR